MKTRMLLLFLGIALVGSVAYGHHSISATYDVNNEIVLEGKLVQLLYRNPHSFVHIEAPDADGKMQRWAVEWGGARQLQGQGVSHDTFKVGDELVISGNPSRTPREYRVKMNTLHRLSDGFGWGTRPGEVVD